LAVALVSFVLSGGIGAAALRVPLLIPGFSYFAAYLFVAEDRADRPFFTLLSVVHRLRHGARAAGTLAAHLATGDPAVLTSSLIRVYAWIATSNEAT
jgi:hypothetical protein